VAMERARGHGERRRSSELGEETGTSEGELGGVYEWGEMAGQMGGGFE
jgi:hypothetical protein